MRITAMLLIFVAAAATAHAEESADGDLRVKALSFNIRYGTASDGENAWPNRRELVFQVIRSEKADFVGLQEALGFQIEQILEAVDGYAMYGRGRNVEVTEGEYSAILYRPDRWKLERGDTVWLSNTPEEPASTGWGNSIPRIITWALFSEKESGREVYVFNTHFDHRSQPSREKSAKMLAELIGKHAGDKPLIVTGDFNADEQNPAIEHLTDDAADPPLVDTFRVVHPDAETVGTFNGFVGHSEGGKIDYVFTRPGTRVLSAEIIRTHADGRYPSDHYPVSAELAFGGE